LNGPLAYLPPTQSLSDSLNDSTDTQSVHGNEGAESNPLIQEFPQNQAELGHLKQTISDKIDRKYEILKKNINLHLCYLYLMTYDYGNVIKTGNGILRNQSPTPRTR